MNDRDAMLAIQELLDGVEWTPTTLNDDDAVGIDEDGMALTLADDRYEDEWLDIGTALSSDFIHALDAARRATRGAR